MKNILIVSDAWKPQINGVVTTIDNTVRVLEQRRYNVRLITPANYKTIPLPSYPEIGLAVPPYHLNKDMEWADAIHISTEAPLGIAARIASAKMKRLYTTAYHTKFPEYVWEHYYVPTSATYKMMKWFHGKSQKIMTPTTSMMDLLKSKGFKNVVKWGRGVNSTLFHPRSIEDYPVGARPYFLNVGRVSPEKNLEAFLSLELPGTKIVIGDGPQLPYLENKFPNTVFLGAKTGEELAQWFNRADVFVFPSKTDTFGLVIAEAISSGLPVAGYNVTGPKDIVEQGKTGFYGDDLKEAALNCLSLNRELVSRDFSWDVATDQFLSNLCFR